MDITECATRTGESHCPYTHLEAFLMQEKHIIHGRSPEGHCSTHTHTTENPRHNQCRPFVCETGSESGNDSDECRYQVDRSPTVTKERVISDKAR